MSKQFTEGPSAPEPRPQVYYTEPQSHYHNPYESNPYNNPQQGGFAQGSHGYSDANTHGHVHVHDQYNPLPHDHSQHFHPHDHYQDPDHSHIDIPFDDANFDDSNPTCRLCFEAGGVALIAPCECRGSMKYVHRACLDRWRAMSPRAQSFYQCDQCLANYQFIEKKSAVSPLRYLKYILLVGLDLFFYFLVWQILLVICSGFTWGVDALLANGAIAKAVSWCPTPVQYFIVGIGLLFFIIGILGIIFGTIFCLYSAVDSLLNGRKRTERSEPMIHSRGRSHMQTQYHHYASSHWYTSDLFLFWFLFARPTYFYPMYHPYTCFCAPIPCNISLPSINTGGSGGGSDNLGAVLLVIAIIVIVIVIIVGMIVALLVTVYVIYASCTRHFSIVKKRDDCKLYIVKDLADSQNNLVNVLSVV